MATTQKTQPIKAKNTTPKERKTPKEAKRLFHKPGLLIPVANIGKKTPLCPDPLTYEKNCTGNKFVGLKLSKFPLIIADFDIHPGKGDYTKCKRSLALFNELDKICTFKIETPHGWHLYFLCPKDFNFKKFVHSKGFKIEDWEACFEGVNILQAPQTTWLGLYGEDEHWEQFKRNTDLFEGALKEINTELLYFPEGFTPPKNIKTKNWPIIQGFEGNKKDIPKMIEMAKEGKLDSLKKAIIWHTERSKTTKKQAEKEPMIYRCLEEADFDLMEDVPKLKLDYLDPKTKIILNKVLVTLSGPKGVGKSSGMLSFLRSLNKNILYFSDNEVMREVVDQYNKLFLGRKQGGFIYRFKGKELIDDTYFEKFKQFIVDKKINVVFEDPMYEREDLYSMEGLRKILGGRNYWASQLGITWIVTRNHNKEGQISGFKQWEDIPRAVIEFFNILPTSKTSVDLHKDQKQNPDDLKRLTLLRTKIANLGEMPSKAFILKHYSNSNYPAIPDISFDDIERPTDSNLKAFCEGPTTKEKQQKESNEAYSLAILSEFKDGLSSGGWQKKILDNLKVVDKTARNYIRTLIDDGLVEGKKNGRTTTFKLKPKGQVFLDSLNR